MAMEEYHVIHTFTPYPQATYAALHRQKSILMINKFMFALGVHTLVVLDSLHLQHLDHKEELLLWIGGFYSREDKPQATSWFCS